MSASARQSPAHDREAGSGRAAGGVSSGIRQWASALVACSLALAAAGCSDGKPSIADPTPSPVVATPSVTASAADEQQVILGQYRKFWASLTDVSRMPASQRRAALSPFTVDPELKSLLAGMAATDRKGEVFYGADITRATMASVSADGTRAVVTDCLDSSGSGNQERASGKKITVGVARNHVVVTMANVAGIWRVYFVSYPKTPC